MHAKWYNGWLHVLFDASGKFGRANASAFGMISMFDWFVSASLNEQINDFVNIGPQFIRTVHVIIETLKIIIDEKANKSK